MIHTIIGNVVSARSISLMISIVVFEFFLFDVNFSPHITHGHRRYMGHYSKHMKTTHKRRKSSDKS